MAVESNRTGRAAGSAADPGVAPLLLSVREVAKVTGLGERTIWRLSASEGMPAPVRVGGRRLWRFREIQQWVDAGCPGKAGSRGGAGRSDTARCLPEKKIGAT
jgi:excisionase family DNA binding protein